MRSAKVTLFDEAVGRVWEDEHGFHFQYSTEYVQSENTQPVSLTLPVGEKVYTSKTILPFFDGLIPEGWLLDIAEQYWKITPRDRMGLLLACCRDCIGAVGIIPEDATK